MRSTSTPRGVDCEGLGGRKIIRGGWSTVASSVEGGSPVGAWTRGHRDSSSGQRGTMDVSIAQGGVSWAGGGWTMAVDGECSRRKTTIDAMASPGGLTSRLTNSPTQTMMRGWDGHQ
jgi:hypothetical protein